MENKTDEFLMDIVWSKRITYRNKLIVLNELDELNEFSYESYVEFLENGVNQNATKNFGPKRMHPKKIET